MRLALSDFVIPDLTVRTFAIPTEVAVGDGFEREVLKTAEQAILFGNLNHLTQNFNRYQLLVGIQQFAGIERRWGLVNCLLVHSGVEEYNPSCRIIPSSTSHLRG